MKTVKNIALVLCLFTISMTAFAGNKTAKKDLTLDKTTKLGSLNLKPGTYTLKWDESSTTPEVQVLKNGSEVGKVPAKVVDAENKSNAAFQFSTSGESQELTRVYLKHKALDFSSGS